MKRCDRDAVFYTFGHKSAHHTGDQTDLQSLKDNV